MAIDPVLKFMLRYYEGGVGPSTAPMIIPVLPYVPKKPIAPVTPATEAIAPSVPTITSAVASQATSPASIPAIDPNLYRPIPTELPPGIDYKQFPVPQMPTYQQMPMMPQRQFQQEAAGAQKASLRAGLIGLLLGGGAGAVAAASGAQQAYQQNVQNQYEQALREYQNRANLTEMANAQAAQRYRDELAARQAAVGEAESTYRMEAGRLGAIAEGKRAEQELRRQYQEAVRANDIARAERIAKAFPILPKLAPGSHAIFLKWVGSGGDPENVPVGGFQAAQQMSAASVLSAYSPKTLQQRFAGVPHTDPAYQKAVAAHNNAVMGLPEEFSAIKPGLIIDPKASNPEYGKTQRAERGVQAREKATETGAKRAQAAITYMEWRKGFAERQQSSLEAYRSNSLSIRKASEEAKKAGKPPKIDSQLSSIKSEFNRQVAVLGALLKQQKDPVGSVMRSQAENILLQQDIDNAKLNIKTMSEDPNITPYFTFSSIGTNTPAMTRKVGPPANVPKPAGGSQPTAGVNEVQVPGFPGKTTWRKVPQ